MKLEAGQTNFKIRKRRTVFRKSCSTSKPGKVGAVFEKLHVFFVKIDNMPASEPSKPNQTSYLASHANQASQANEAKRNQAKHTKSSKQSKAKTSMQVK